VVNEMPKRKAVVTGGAGFIGSHLGRELVAQGFEVHAVDNFCCGKKKERLSADTVYHEIDITTDELGPAFQGADYVFHTAAMPRVQYSLEYPLKSNESNVTGTVRVLIAARDANVKKVIYSASSSAYGNSEALPLVEALPAHPISPYGLQKYVGELYMRLFSEVYGVPTVSLRYFNVYGPLADPEGAYALVIAKFIKQRVEGRPLTISGDGSQTRDYTHVHDVVRANILAAHSNNVGRGEALNIGAGRNVSVNRLAELIGGSVEHIEPRLEPHDTLADNVLARRLLGWEPKIPLEEGIAELKNLHGIDL
jgi:nucleoside-diphosphate-sugar epimerase